MKSSSAARRFVVAVVMAVSATAVMASPSAAADLYSCDHFGFQEDAQVVLDQDRSDPHRLDNDGDGIACEGNRRRGTSSAPPIPLPTIAVGAAANASSTGLWLGYSNGDVRTHGDAASFGNVANLRLNAPIVGMAATARADGYWLLGGDGEIFSFGNAPFLGSTGDMRLNQPVVSIASDPQGRGYWFVASDGGIFSFGAPFFGSTGDIRLNQPLVGMAPAKSGNGYWLVARDGGIFSFGAADFYGSTGDVRLNQPIVGMATTPSGDGYWMVAEDGGIFSFGDAQFYGSGVGVLATGDRVTAMVTHPAGGYWLIAASGTVLAFGAAEGLPPPGITGGSRLEALRVGAPDDSVPYKRDSWVHWSDADRDCQDTRDEVLIVESTVTVTLSANGCDVVAGRWVDIYTGAVFTDPSLLDIDHMVALANAHRSGGWAWDAARKAAFANHLDLSDHLIAVSASANRSKGDRSPDQWVPANAAAHCRYATAWVDVKFEWSLTVTTAEKTRLQQLLAAC